MTSRRSVPWITPGEELRQLDLALRPSAIVGPLAKLMGEGIGTEDPSRCRILDVRYEPGVRCSILYELDGRFVIGTMSWREAQSRSRRRAGDGSFPVLSAFPADPELPGLMNALRPEMMIPRLDAVLPGRDGGQWRVVRCAATSLRYRPNRRCTIRYDLWARHAGTHLMGRHTLYGKVYPDARKAQAVHTTMEELADLVERREGHLVLARSPGVLTDLALTLQEPLTGTPLDVYLRPTEDGRGGSEQAGAPPIALAAVAVAELHALGATHPRVRRIGDELRKVTDRTRAITTVAPSLGTSMLSVAHTLAHRMGPLGLEETAVTLVHGDCKPSQFLLDGSAVGLLDFDHAGMGDPALDVGTFLASLRQLGCRATVKSGRDHRAWHAIEEMETTFLDAYRSAAGDDARLDDRATWYQAFALLRKSWRAYGRSVRSPLASMLVDEASRCLDRLEVSR